MARKTREKTGTIAKQLLGERSLLEFELEETVDSVDSDLVFDLNYGVLVLEGTGRRR